MRGPPVCAERPGRAKPRFRAGGAERRGFQTRQRRVQGGVELERPWSLLQRRRDLDLVFPRLRLSTCSAEGGSVNMGCWIGSEPRRCCRCLQVSERLGSRSLWRPPLPKVGLKGGLLEMMAPVRTGYGAVLRFVEAVGGPAMTGPVAWNGMLAICAAAGHRQEDDPENSPGDPSFELGLTGLLSGPMMPGSRARTGLKAGIGPELQLTFGLFESVAEEFDRKSKTNLLPRLLAPEEAEDGASSNPTGMELAFS